MQLSRINPNFQTFNALQYGVDLFFVISGFVMAYSTDGGLKLSAAEFFKRRLLRIVPLLDSDGSRGDSTRDWLAIRARHGIFMVTHHLVVSFLAV